MIAACTLLLKLPRATPVGQSIGWIDALFTATSAVCVTGLIVRDTATQFTPFGQTIIGVFIQLGGLGIMIFGAVFAALLGSRMSLRENVSLSQMLSDQPLARLVSFTRFVVLATLAIELLGALLMMPMWHAPMPLGERFGRSLFHSVSAFCNAGFALQTDSLEGYRFNVLTHHRPSGAGQSAQRVDASPVAPPPGARRLGPRSCQPRRGAADAAHEGGADDHGRAVPVRRGGDRDIAVDALRARPFQPRDDGERPRAAAAERGRGGRDAGGCELHVRHVAHGGV